MQIHDLTTTECRDVLSRAHVARIACSRANQPYVVPVSISYDRTFDCLFGFSTVGKKIDWMRENPRVCVEVEEVADRYNWTTIVIFGRYNEVADSVEHREIRSRALHLFEHQSRWWLPATAKMGEAERHAVVIYQINIDSMSGRRTARDSS